jgi:diketogulonate reductase-like aldo/keto reductase
MIESDNRSRPSFIYGTAWKQDATAGLVTAAIECGFRAIDTANQPRHYSERLVGEALKAAFEDGLTRESLFIQTKFTPLGGHDHRVPYDANRPLGSQVDESFASSLRNLGVDYVDAYLLHGPYGFPGISDSDREVWRAIGAIHESGRARAIGVSNVNTGQLRALVGGAGTPPMVVQNRCYADRGWDREVRSVCREHGIMYQGFSLLTANVSVLGHPGVIAIARRLGVGTSQIVFRFSIQAGMVPLTGTTDRGHMREDLDVERIELTPEEVEFIENIAS